MQTLDALFKNKYKNLPSTVREIIDSPETGKFIDSLTEKFNLDEVKQDILNEELLYTLFSEKSITSFKNNLSIDLLISDEMASKIYKEIDSQLFSEIRKFLRETPSINDQKEKERDLITQKIFVPEDLNHHDILKEIEAPSPSLKTTITQNTIPTQNSVPALQTMPKEVQKLMGTDANITETTKAPSLQDAVGNMMPPIGTVGGFKPVDNPLKPAEKVASTFDSKLQEVVKTPVKEVYLPKKPDPYRESIE